MKSIKHTAVLLLLSTAFATVISCRTNHQQDAVDDHDNHTLACDAIARHHTIHKHVQPYSLKMLGFREIWNGLSALGISSVSCQVNNTSPVFERSVFLYSFQGMTLGNAPESNDLDGTGLLTAGLNFLQGNSHHYVIE